MAQRRRAGHRSSSPSLTFCNGAPRPRPAVLRLSGRTGGAPRSTHLGSLSRTRALAHFGRGVCVVETPQASFRETFVANNRVGLCIQSQGFDFTTIAADSVQLEGNFIDVEQTDFPSPRPADPLPTADSGS